MQTGWEGQKNQLRCFFSFIYFPSSSVKKKEAVSISLLTSFLWGCGVFFELLDFFFSPAKLSSLLVLFIILSTERGEKEWILEEKQKPAASCVLSYPAAFWPGTRRLATPTHTAGNWVCRAQWRRRKPFTASLLTDCHCAVPFMSTPPLIGTGIKISFGQQTARVSSREIKARQEIKGLALFPPLTHGQVFPL